MNGALALVAAGQIEIDVRPFAALLGKKSLEKQLHAHRIDGGNSQRVADRAVGRRTASLHQNILLAAEANNVPDDQEIAGQIQFFDHGQFAFDLLPRALVVRSVAAEHAVVRALAQKMHLRSAIRHRINRKLVAQIVQGELQARRKHLRVGDGFGKIRKSCFISAGDFRWRSELRASRRPAVASVR